jgi:hypothetical protein
VLKKFNLKISPTISESSSGLPALLLTSRSITHKTGVLRQAVFKSYCETMIFREFLRFFTRSGFADGEGIQVVPPGNGSLEQG